MLVRSSFPFNSPGFSDDKHLVVFLEFGETSVAGNDPCFKRGGRLDRYSCLHVEVGRVEAGKDVMDAGKLDVFVVPIAVEIAVPLTVSNPLDNWVGCLLVPHDAFSISVITFS